MSFEGAWCMRGTKSGGRYLEGMYVGGLMKVLLLNDELLSLPSL